MDYRWGIALGALLAASPVCAQQGESGSERAAQDEQRSRTPAAPVREDDDADEIVVTARYSGYAETVSDTALKVPVPLKELPQAATIINSDFIRDINARNLNDVAPFVAGATVKDQGFFGGDRLNIRGQQLDQQNGYKLDGGQVQQDAQIDPAVIDSIEILKGPVASLYGRGPGVGVVNYISKRPLADFGVRTDLEVGTSEHLRGVLDVNMPLGERARSRFIAYGSHDDNGVNSKDAHVLGGYATFEFDLTETTKLRLTDSFKNFRNERGIYRTSYLDGGGNIVLPFFLDRNAITGASNDLFKYNDNLVTGRLDQNLGGLTDLVIRGAYDHYNRYARSTQIFGFPDPPEFGAPINVDDVFFGSYGNRRIESLNGEVNLIRRVDHGAFAGSSLLLGASIDRTDLKNRFAGVALANPATTIVVTENGADFGPLVQTGPFTTSSDTRTVGKGTFGQVVVKYAGLTFLASGRYDWYKATDRESAATDREEKFSYRLGASYAVTPTLNVFAGYGTGFNPLGNLGLNGFLPPEVDKNVEAGIKYSSTDGRSNFDITAFHTKKTNTAISLPPPNDAFLAPNGTQRFKGIEADAQITPLPGLDLIAAGAIIDVRLESGARSYATPKYNASGFVRYDLTRAGVRGLSVSGGLTYYGRATINDPGGDFGGLNRVAVAPAYTLVRAGIAYNGLGFGDLGLTASNLFNKRYFIGNQFLTGNIIEGNPRAVTLSLRSKF